MRGHNTHLTENEDALFLFLAELDEVIKKG
jgi:hypothetical protein